MRFRSVLAVVTVSTILAAGLQVVEYRPTEASAATVVQPAVAPPPASTTALAATFADRTSVPVPVAPYRFTDPQLDFKHNDVPGSVYTYTTSPADGAKSVSLTPTLNGKISGWTRTGEFVDFKIAYTVCPANQTMSMGTCNDKPATIYSGLMRGAWTVPGGKLAANTTYKFQMDYTLGTGTATLALVRKVSRFTTGTSLAAVGASDYSVWPTSPGNQAVINTLQPTLTGTMRHAAATSYAYTFNLFSCADTSCFKRTKVATSGDLSSPSWKVPAGVINWRSYYIWEVKARIPGSMDFSIFVPSHSFATVVPVPAGAKLGLEAQSPSVLGVNLSDRHFETSVEDAKVGSLSNMLSINRTYSSSNTRSGAFGIGWSSVLDVALADVSTGKVVRLPDGHEVGFGKNPNGSWAAMPGSEGMALKTCATGCAFEFTDPRMVKYTFGASGLTSVTSSDGFPVTLTRGADGKVSKLTDTQSGRSLTLTWAGGQVAAVTQNGAPASVAAKWSYTYSTGALTKVCQGGTRCITYAFSTTTPRLMTSVTSPNGLKSPSIVWSGAAVSSLTVDGMPHTFTQAPSGTNTVVTSTSGTGAVDKYTLDVNGKLLSLLNHRGGTEAWVYDNQGRTHSYKSAEGWYVGLRYNDVGQVIGRDEYLPGQTLSNRTTYVYGTEGSAKGRPVLVLAQGFAETGPLAEMSRDRAVLEYTYDSAGRIASITRGGTPALRPVTTNQYTSGTEAAVGGGVTPAGLLKLTDDSRHGVTKFAYDSKGQLVTKTDARGATTTFAYDWSGNLTKERLSGTRGEWPQATTYTYDAFGNLASRTTPKVVDAVTGAAHELSQSMSYNADGHVTSIVEKDTQSLDSRTTSFKIDVFGRVLTVTGADGVVQQQNTYDQFGQLTASTDAAGLTTRLTYTPSGDVSKRYVSGVSNKSNSVAHDVVLEEATYDGAGRVKTHKDRAGVVREYVYFAGEQLLKVIARIPQPDGSVSERVDGRWVYDSRGRVWYAIQGTKEVLFEYDAVGRPRSMTTSTDTSHAPGTGRKTEYTYNADDLLASETVVATAPIKSTRYEYSAAGDVVATYVGRALDDANAVKTSYVRDDFGRVTSIQDPRSTATTPVSVDLTWDQLNQQTAQYETAGAIRVATKYGYDAYGNATSVAKPSGITSDAKYDVMNRKLSVSSWHLSSETPSTEKWTYTPGGIPATYTNQLGDVTSYVSTPLGEVTQVSTHRDGEPDRVQRYGFDDAGHQVSFLNQVDVMTTGKYDRLGQLIEQTTNVAGRAATSRFEYDVNGNLTKFTSPEGRVSSSTYNALSELTASTDADGASRELVRDAAGRVVSEKRSDGTATWANYDAQGNTTRLSIVDSASGKPLRSWNWTYDKAGYQTAQVDALSRSRSFSYSPRGFLTEMTVEDGTKVSFGYDIEGRTTSFTDGNGNTTKANYDSSSRMVSLIEPSTPDTSTVALREWQWQYDAVGQTTRVKRPGGGESTYAYNVDGKMTKETSTTGALTASRTFGYDRAGRLIDFAHPAGRQTVAYDELSRPVGSSGPYGSSTFGYDRDGNLTAKQTSAGTETFTYDAGNRLSRATSPGGSYGFEYAGQRLTAIVGDNGRETRTYDLLGNMTGQTVTNAGATLIDDKYTFDAVGNRTSFTSNRLAGSTVKYSYDSRDRLTGWSDGKTSSSVTWDKAGNMLTMGGVTRTYDARNRLTTVGTAAVSNSPDGRRLGLGNETYEYDAFGQLSKAGAKPFAYDGRGRLASDGSTSLIYRGLERDPSQAGSSNFFRDPSGRLLGVSGSVAVQDARGDVIASRGAAGLAFSSYLPFGAATPAATGALGFQGDYTVGSLVNMDARWYDSATGTFLQRDNIALGLDEQNRYGYALGNPLRHSDPSGHCAAVAPVCGGVGGFAVGGLPGAVVGVVAGFIVLGAGLYAADTISQNPFFWDNISLPARQPATTTNAAHGNAAAHVTLTSPISYQASGAALGGVGGLSMAVSPVRIPSIHITIPRIDINIPTLNLDFSFDSVWQGTYTKPSVSGATALSMYSGAATSGATACASGTVSCASTLGTMGQSCAGIGSALASTCGVNAPSAIWANEPAAGEFTQATTGAEAIRATAAGPSGGCMPGEISTEVGCEDPMTFLQRKVDEYREQLSSDKAARDDRLSSAELQAEQQSPWLQSLNNGKAIERSVGSDPSVASNFIYRGGAGQPDFVSRTGGLFYELTTTNPATIATHLRRTYVSVDRIVKYTMWFFGG